MLDPGDPVWIEDPGYLGARGAFLGAGARIIPVPVDEEGLIVEAGVARAPHARLVYLTPSHQFPLGVTMSLPRRLALLNWAWRAGAYLLEDDYDSEYRFVDRPLASLQGLDDAERRAALLEAVRDLPLEILSPQAGIHCVGWLPPEMDMAALLRAAASHNIDLTPLVQFCMEPLARPGLLLGYGGFSAADIMAGVQRLAQAMQSVTVRGDNSKVVPSFDH